MSQTSPTGYHDDDALQRLMEIAEADPVVAIGLSVAPRQTFEQIKNNFTPAAHNILLTALTDMSVYGNSIPQLPPEFAFGVITGPRLSTQQAPEGDLIESPEGPISVTIEGTQVVETLFEQDVYIWPYDDGVRSWQYAWGKAEMDRANAGFVLAQHSGHKIDVSGSSDLAVETDSLTARLIADWYDPPVSATDPRLRLGPEAGFYARDPEDVGVFLDDYITNQPDASDKRAPLLRAQLASFNLPTPTYSEEHALNDYDFQLVSIPQSLSLQAPIMASGDGASYRSQAHRELFADDFYGPMEAGDTERNDLFVQFVKPGPGTDGSDWHYEIPQINAVHVSLPGLCTKEFSFQSLFNPPPNQTSPLDIRSIVTSALGDCSQRLGHLYIDEIIALPVLRHNAGDRHDWRAQLFVHISAYAKQAQFPALDCHVIGNALYDVFLDVDGRLRASVSNWSIADAGGSGCSDPNPVISSLFPPFALFGATSSVFPPGGRKIMAWVMSTQIPVALNHQFEMFQGTVTTGAGQKFPVINPVSCNASDRPLCAALRTRMCNLVRKGFALAPAPWGGRSGDSWNAGCLDSQSAAVAQSMQTAPAASPGQADDDARLHRLLAAINDDALWTCPNKFSAGIIPEESFCPPAPSPCGVCAFSPPIRRLIVKQDSLQFVLYDGPEYDNASLALSYAIVGLLGGGRVGTAQYPSVICDDVRRLNNYSSNFYRTPNIFYLRNACGCPTESVPNPLNPSLWNPQTDVGGVPLGAGGDYSQACLCPQGQHESFGLCCANNQSNCKGNCASSAC